MTEYARPTPFTYLMTLNTVKRRKELFFLGGVGEVIIVLSFKVKKAKVKTTISCKISGSRK